MGNLFTRQIRKRAQADEEMRRKADGLINEAITRKKTRDIFEEVNSNEEALDAILFICGIEEDRLDNLENEDILFTRVETDPDWYRCQTGCCIGIDTEGKYVALVPGLFLDYYYYDADGKKQRVNKKNAGRFTRVYCLCRLLPDLTLSIPDLLRYLLSFLRRKNLISFIVITLAAGILGLVFPRTVTALMNTADPSAAGGTLRTDFITKVAVLCLLAELLRLLLNMLLAVFGSGFTNMVCYNIKNAALIRYLSDSGENSQQDTTEVWNAINRSVPEFTESLLSSGINMIPHLVFVVFYCLAAAYYLGKTSLWMFLVLAVLALSLWIVNTRFDHWYSLTVKNYFRGTGILFQIFRGIEKIRSREAQKRVYLKWAQIYSEEAFSDRYRKKWQSAGLGVQDFVGPAMTVVLILAVTRRPVSGSAFFTGTLLAGLLAGQTAELILDVERIVNSRSLWQTISFLFVKEEKEKKVKCTEFKPRVRVEKVSFSYPGMDMLLKNISFEVKEGEYIGIVGMSGCGKSTLLKLMMGILHPNKGEISYDKYALSETDARSILQNIGIVLQNETLIPGTIRQNLMMQPRPVTEESMWKTLEKVGIADLIRSFPNGLDTELKSSDSHMSGGQTQKLLIARAIISEPRMLIFDEATSALDNVSQQEIKDVLDAMNCTRIVVAHRLSTVRDCDRILLLDDGIISQEGTYEELMASNELFREMVMCQSL